MDNVVAQEGKYIYCIIEANETQSFGPLGIGGRGDELFSICLDGVGAVVSNSPIKKYSLARENSLTHERAIEEVMKEYPVLPVRFCTITKDEEKVKKILTKEHDRFKDLLNKMRDKKELNLKALFKEEIIYKDILEKYKDIRKQKEALLLLREPAAKTYPQRREIGEKVESALQKERAIYKEEILNVLSPLAEDIKINSNYGEMMIINAAFLVAKDKEAEFDKKVQQLDAKYGAKINFKYVGTLPLFNFVNLVIETDRD
jgi:hypothetical protein